MVLHLAEKPGYTSQNLNLGILEFSRFKIWILRLQDNDILITVKSLNSCLFIFEQKGYNNITVVGSVLLFDDN
ncbi:hypothetical protein ELI_2210 [Eubacterium callanderi]|uniref:Uncharacterized protein n=1 Tax=Eubacterium callanderi TaxID=53442 RepID=E3GNK8_9FIRM|nr:hypothetical protein ELI_2210 [Eubacterium callanderi]